jgi:hypothetical protein
LLELTLEKRNRVISLAVCAPDLLLFIIGASLHRIEGVFVELQNHPMSGLNDAWTESTRIVGIPEA